MRFTIRLEQNFLKTEYENITVYYGYLKTKPDDYWISVDGDKVAINL